jgi:hypothetical protein
MTTKARRAGALTSECCAVYPFLRGERTPCTLTQPTNPPPNLSSYTRTTQSLQRVEVVARFPGMGLSGGETREHTGARGTRRTSCNESVQWSCLRSPGGAAWVRESSTHSHGQRLSRTTRGAGADAAPTVVTCEGWATVWVVRGFNCITRRGEGPMYRL